MAGLLVFKLIINTAHRAAYPFLPAIARGLGIGLGPAGVLVSARWAAGLATPLLVGATRRHRPRNLLLAGAALFVFGAAVTASTGVFFGALAGFALLGVAKPLFDIGSAAYVSERSAYERRGRLLGTLELSWAGGLLVGAPLFGWLIDRYDWTAPFWAVAAAGAVGALAIAGSGRRRTEPVDLPILPRSRMGSPAKALLAVIGLFSLAMELVFVVLGAWLEGSFGLTLLALGGVGTLLGAAELLGEGGVVGLVDRLGKYRSLRTGMAAAVPALIGLALVGGGSVGVALAVLTVVAFLFEFTIVSAIPLATELRPDDRVKYLAWFVVAGGAGRMVGDWVGPAVHEALGFPAVAGGAAGLTLVAWLILSARLSDVG